MPSGNSATAPSIAVIGGGVVGCAAAYFLSQRDASVTLFDTDGIAAKASGLAFGSLQPGFSSQAPANPTPFDLVRTAALTLHRQLATTLPHESGIGYDFRGKRSALLMLSDDEAQITHTQLATTGSDSGLGNDEERWLSRDELRALEPRVSPECAGALLTENAYQVDPYRFSLALWYAGQSRGAILVPSNVTRLNLQGNTITGVVIGDDVHSFDYTVMAAGAWSAPLLRAHDISLPIVPVKGQILRIRVDSHPLELTFSWGVDYAASKPDGLVWVGTTEEHTGFDNSPSEWGREMILKSIARVFPYLLDGNILRQTACLRPIPRDGMPIIGAIPGVDRLLIATGAGRNGITLGPAMGKAISDLISTGTTDVPVAGLSPDRFM